MHSTSLSNPDAGTTVVLIPVSLVCTLSDTTTLMPESAVNDARDSMQQGCVAPKHCLQKLYALQPCVVKGSLMLHLSRALTFLRSWP